jgi:hypothetical protein
VSGGNNASPDCFCRLDFVKSEAGSERMKVDDVGLLLFQPFVKILSSAHYRPALTLPPARLGRYGIAEHRYPIVPICPGSDLLWVRRRNANLVSCIPDLSAEGRHISLSSTCTIRVIPFNCLHDFQTGT